jgi:Zn-dependent protease with chaperone function
MIGKDRSMNARTTQLTTRLRTWSLVAGLTALTIAIGAILGGTFLWLFVVIAIAFNVVGYFFSDRIALGAARARPLTVDDAPELHAIVNPLAGGTVATLFSTHPPVRERIRRLRAYGARSRTERTTRTASLSGA